MRHAARWVVVTVGAALLAGCGPEFEGQEGELGFDSSMSRPWASWTPESPVATGSAIHVWVTTQVRDPETDENVRPQALPTIDGESLLGEVVAKPDSLDAVAVAAGETTIRWAGPLASDWFPLAVADAVSARVTDPLYYRDLVNADVQWLEGGPWADVGASFLLAAGSELFLDADLRDAEDRRLAFSPGLVAAAPGAGSPGVEAAGQGVIVSAGAAGASTHADLQVGGVSLGGFEVQSVDPAEIVSLALSVARLSESGFVLQATARRADGEVVWQPPVVWAVEDGFSAMDQKAEGFAPPRTDLLVLGWEGIPEGPFGPMTRTVDAAVGDVKAQVVLEVENVEPPPEPEAETPAPAPGPSCGCSVDASGPGAPLAGLLLLSWGLGAEGRRRRRRA